MVINKKYSVEEYVYEWDMFIDVEGRENYYALFKWRGGSLIKAVAAFHIKACKLRIRASI
jgi:hypothetical protein